MEAPTPPTPSPETVDAAYKSLIEFGVVGAILAIVLACCIALVWWVLHSSRKRIDKVENDSAQRVKDVETQSNDRAKSYREVINGQEERIDRLETRLDQSQEKRVSGMEVAVTAVTTMNERTGRMMSMLGAILKQLDIDDDGSNPSEEGGS